MPQIKNKVVASIEARMGSSRLPGKVLMDIVDHHALARLVMRLKQSKKIDDIVVATTVSTKDDLICDWCQKNAIAYHRGSEDNVLDRVVQAHQKMQSNVIVEVTGDCTLLDPSIIDQGIDIFLNNHYDVVTNTVELSYAQGIDVQVFSYKNLKWVNDHIDDQAVLEHVSLYFYENPDKYHIYHMKAPDHLRAPFVRMQLDYQEDLDFIRKIYQHLEPKYGPYFSYE
ncbi:MAG: hypothetical protein AAF403_08875, partial [Pseudomonadota bacterium]